ncbi:ABC transporter ATP-binding protein [Roseospira marina]|uniref:ABC transporter ATP-binding protein n=1 Tax=Roseospira marina TaxID=140057 RepID=A0A5M6IGP3_9PROT|nr:ABC transporter ATP-binding protein [Roseospira marina]KAA5606748.1 ABC transporter ATP-binding protein [Roseospira marina]MBB4313832.1 multiple sugar transport system ATP-binding protein [Roseospira marina]MBB5086994.1 multiple sugar transport system ATP-binding protein [Roseospira marina]
MAGVAVEGLVKRFGRVAALDGVTATLADGTYAVIVGRSGCGKSTLLRLLAGLEEPDAGTIRIGDADVTARPPKHRDIAMVFQSYALYPHMTVFENMAFGLRLRDGRRDRAAITGRVREAARMLHLEDLLNRRPAALSGGQRQRVAIGRAVVRDPAVLLLDEPLSNLDAGLRLAVRRELATLHRRLGTTMVHVTHDQTEAMTLADVMVLMEAGRVVQIGPPLELYGRPATPFAARFLGTPPMNLRAGTVVDGEGTVALEGGGRVTLEAARGLPSGAAVEVGIRPEALAPCESEAGFIAGPVALVEHLGESLLVHVDVEGGEPVVARLGPEVAVRAGTAVGLTWAAAAAHLFYDGRRRDPVEVNPAEPPR